MKILLNKSVDVVCIFVHELSHWIPAFVFFILGFLSFPVLRIKINTEERESFGQNVHSYQVAGCVDYNYREGCPNMIHYIVLIAPAISTISLLTIGYLYEYYWLIMLVVLKIDAFWLSDSDINQIKNL